MNIIHKLCTNIKYMCFFLVGGDLKEERLRLERSKYASEGTIRGKEKDEILGTKLTMRLLWDAGQFSQVDSPWFMKMAIETKCNFYVVKFEFWTSFIPSKENKICSELRKYRTKAPITEFIFNDNLGTLMMM